MVAVVASLILVVYSLNQNTAALQGEHANLVFERHSELQLQFITDESLAAIRVKVRGEQALSDIEQERWNTYIELLLDVWVMAYHRHNQGLLTEEQWLPWDDYFATLFSASDERLTRDRYDALAYGYAEDFWLHVGERLFEAPSTK